MGLNPRRYTIQPANASFSAIVFRSGTPRHTRLQRQVTQAHASWPCYLLPGCVQITWRCQTSAPAPWRTGVWWSTARRRCSSTRSSRPAPTSTWWLLSWPTRSPTRSAAILWLVYLTPLNIFSLTRHLNDVISNYVFFVEIPLIQFGCLLLVCPLLCFLLPSVVFYLSSFTWRRLSVESACVFVSSFVVHWWVQFASFFPNFIQLVSL